MINGLILEPLLLHSRNNFDKAIKHLYTAALIYPSTGSRNTRLTFSSVTTFRLPCLLDKYE